MVTLNLVIFYKYGECMIILSYSQIIFFYILSIVHLKYKYTLIIIEYIFLSLFSTYYKV